jgi:hypothetical protein
MIFWAVAPLRLALVGAAFFDAEDGFGCDFLGFAVEGLDADFVVFAVFDASRLLPDFGFAALADTGLAEARRTELAALTFGLGLAAFAFGFATRFCARRDDAVFVLGLAFFCMSPIGLVGLLPAAPSSNGP